MNYNFCQLFTTTTNRCLQINKSLLRTGRMLLSNSKRKSKNKKNKSLNNNKINKIKSQMLSHNNKKYRNNLKILRKFSEKKSLNIKKWNLINFNKFQNKSHKPTKLQQKKLEIQFLRVIRILITMQKF